MKFIRFQFKIAWDMIVIIPTVTLTINELYYGYLKNVRLSVHWLGWHLSWLWLDNSDII